VNICLAVRQQCAFDSFPTLAKRMMLRVGQRVTMEAPPKKPAEEITEALGDVALWKKRASVVSELAGLLSTKTEGSGALTASSRVKALRKLLSESLKDHDVALTLPSLDLGLVDAPDDLNSSVLPVIGQHREMTVPVVPVDECRPAMAASVLASATEGSANLEDKAAQNIGKITSWTKSTLDYAADAVTKNVSSSFALLVDARVRAWTLLLLRHSLSSGDSESRSKLMSMLASSIKIESAWSNFKALPLPDSAAGQATESGVILPLLFEVVLHATLHEKQESITVRAPGTIFGKCDLENDLLCSQIVS
jgi:hypothetical protein